MRRVVRHGCNTIIFLLLGAHAARRRLTSPNLSLFWSASCPLSLIVCQPRPSKMVSTTSSYLKAPPGSLCDPQQPKVKGSPSRLRLGHFVLWLHYLGPCPIFGCMYCYYYRGNKLMLLILIDGGKRRYLIENVCTTHKRDIDCSPVEIELYIERWKAAELTKLSSEYTLTSNPSPPRSLEIRQPTVTVSTLSTYIRVFVSTRSTNYTYGRLHSHAFTMADVPIIWATHL